MPKTILILLGCSLFAVQLSADPIYTYVATSASMRSPIGVGTAGFASAPGFAFSGGPPSYVFTAFQVGQEIPLDIPFLDFSPDSSATVDWGGLVQPTDDLAGTFEILTSPSSFVIPPNPNLTYTFAATATGQIFATPDNCMSPGEPLPFPLPLCGTSAVLSIDLPGTLTVQLLPPTPTAPVFYVTELFASTPVPEPSSAALLFVATGLGGVLLLGQRRKLRIKRGQTL